MPGRDASRRESRSGTPVRGGRPPSPEKIFGLPRLVVAVGSGLVFALLLVGLLTLLSSRPDDEANAIRLPDQGRRHLAAGESFELYNSVPPTSGPHPVAGAPPGVYGAEEPAPFDTLPSAGAVLALLEQGGLALYYDPEALPSSDREALRAFVEALRPLRPLLLLMPLAGLANEAQPTVARAPIVVAAWRHLLPIAELDEEGRGALEEFVQPASAGGFYERFVLDSAARAATLTAAAEAGR